METADDLSIRISRVAVADRSTYPSLARHGADASDENPPDKTNVRMANKSMPMQLG